MSADAVADATHAAMVTLPPYAVLYEAVRNATDRDVGLALLRDADPETRALALAYAGDERTRRLNWLRADPRRLAAIKRYYATHVADFIDSWAMTSDPRNIERGKPALVPFHLFPRQRELVDWMIDRWRGSSHGSIIKPRDAGISWVAMSVACTLCLFHDDMVIGVGSRKEELVDRSGDPNTLMWKARTFMQNIPPDFRGAWDVAKHAPHMRIMFPSTNSVITAEAGDNIGRGGRSSLYLVDEAAFLERPKLVDAALSANSNCRIDISSVNGLNSFYDRCMNPNIPCFRINWRDDLRKDDAWYQKQVAELSPAIVGSEIDCNFASSLEGTIIPNEFIQAAVGLHEKLGLKITGGKFASLDVADRGGDLNAMAFRHGVLLTHIESWSGANSDLFATTARAFRMCDDRGFDGFSYDSAGLGAGIRGDAAVLNQTRAKKLRVTEFLGAGEVLFPSRKVQGTNRTAADYFLNFKAQSYHHLYTRFQQSFRASRGEPYDPELLICIDAKIPELSRLLQELGQPTWETSATGKLKCNKAPDGSRSPNLADAVCQVFCPRKTPISFSDAAVAALGRG